MRIVVISNDVVPGFDVPVAAPGLRAAGLAEGLRSHGHEVSVSVPADLMRQLFGSQLPPDPHGVHTVEPTALNDFARAQQAEVVVFINSNLTPHLDPGADVHYVYDLFAPKLLELRASGSATQAGIEQLTQTKVRALAMADSVWVNGGRKIAYAREWLDRADVVAARKDRSATPGQTISLVEMTVPLPVGVDPQRPDRAQALHPLRIGMAGYAQRWSSLDEVHPGHQLLIDRGHELHVLSPGHWGGSTEPPPNALPDAAIYHEGPLRYQDFARWVQSTDVMVDVFRPSPERRMAMITRSAVALRLGVPLIHAVDSEISDIVREFDAGWVLDPDNRTSWNQVCDELADDAERARKTVGAIRASEERFAPLVAVAEASEQLRTLGTAS